MLPEPVFARIFIEFCTKCRESVYSLTMHIVDL